MKEEKFKADIELLRQRFTEAWQTATSGIDNERGINLHNASAVMSEEEWKLISGLCIVFVLEEFTEQMSEFNKEDDDN